MAVFNMINNWNYIINPRLPENPVSTVVISGENKRIIEQIGLLGINTITTNADDRLQEQVQYHADMQMCHLNGNRTVVLKKDILKDKMTDLGFNVTETLSEPMPTYPSDILCNALILNQMLIAKLDSIDNTIIDFATKEGMIIINVAQGYSACATAVISNNAAITADSGIHKALTDKGMDILKIKNNGIELNGYDTGFIGGCCGLIDKDKILFTGKIDSHTDSDIIKEFLNKHKMRIVELDNDRLIDIGGITPILEHR